MKLDRVYVAPSMSLAFENKRKQLAEQIKKETGLSQITIPNGAISEIIGKNLLNNRTTFKFKIRKTGLNSGILEIQNI